jgi:hypothetical protein
MRRQIVKNKLIKAAQQATLAFFFVHAFDAPLARVVPVLDVVA